MTILAIETSCDDTCVAILEAGKKHFKILTNLVSSQVKLHKKYGGVWPYLAKREHQKNLPIVFEKALKDAKNPEIDLITVTIGPGLEPCLWVGVNFAKDLAKKLKVQIIPVNHIEAHIFANFLSSSKFHDREFLEIFPAICLVVSGGHTQLILMRDFGKYKILGETRDDAAGECFDKVARILGLGYPGGPIIEKLSKTYHLKSKTYQIKLPRPMIYQKNYDFSFSGLKTAVFYDFKTRSPKARKSKAYIREMAKEVQQAVIDVLVHKTLKAAKEYKAKSIILGGGVAANDELRRQFNCKLKTMNYKLKFLVPPKIFCTDNAVMVAIAGYFHWLAGKSAKPESVEVNANLRVK